MRTTRSTRALAMPTPRSASCPSTQQQSKFVEGSYVYNNREWYVQDNWKVNPRLTLDYGLRFVNQQPQHDQFGHSANFFPDQWSLANAPLLYRAGCAGGVVSVRRTNRQAMDPRTASCSEPGSAIYIGQLVPGTGNPTQGLIQQGSRASPKYGYVWPTLALAPRFGAAYDVTGRQQLVIRGGGGFFFDRPPGDSVQNLVSNPPFSTGVTLAGGAAAGHRGEPRHRRARRPDTDLRLPLRRRSALVVPVEWRRADDPAVGVVARRVLCRSARVEPAECHRRWRQRAEPEHRRLRRRVPAAESGSDAGGRTPRPARRR